MRLIEERQAECSSGRMLLQKKERIDQHFGKVRWDQSPLIHQEDTVRSREEMFGSMFC